MPRRLDIRATDTVFVGDRVDNDVMPARAEGILAVLYDEDRNGFEVHGLQISLSSLESLGQLLE